MCANIEYYIRKLLSKYAWQTTEDKILSAIESPHLKKNLTIVQTWNVHSDTVEYRNNKPATKLTTKNAKKFIKINPSNCLQKQSKKLVYIAKINPLLKLAIFRTCCIWLLGRYLFSIWFFQVRKFYLFLLLTSPCY